MVMEVYTALKARAVPVKKAPANSLTWVIMRREAMMGTASRATRSAAAWAVWLRSAVWSPRGAAFHKKYTLG